MHSPSETCRAADCTNPVRYLDLCERHYHRAHRAGLKAKEINALTAEEVTEKFGSGEKLHTTLDKKRVEDQKPEVPTDARIVESNIRLALRVKELEAQVKRVRELEALVESLGKQVIDLTAELDSATRPSEGASPVPALQHGEMVIIQVDLDANSRLRCILKGEGCRDVAHLVGRKVRISRLNPADK